MTDLEHPAITRALRTGEAARPGRWRCAECGQPVQPEDPDFRALYDWCGELLCGECFRERLWTLPTGELAALLHCRAVEP